MHSILKIITPASDLSLLTISELREAAGVTGNSLDAQLTAMGLRISAAITRECLVVPGLGKAPTLKLETVEQTLRRVRSGSIVLSRRHDVEIVSLIEDGMLLSATDYVVEPETGLLDRLVSDVAICWAASKVVITYKAGFADVPGDLKQSAMDFARLVWLEGKRDPTLKSVETDIPDVMRERRDYWVGSIPGQSSESAVPDVVAGQLARFRNVWIA